MYWGRWRRYSEQFLKANPFCVHCAAQGVDHPATVTDHVIPHRGDHALFWDPANHQPLCKRHHDQKTAREDGGFGNAPLVREQANQGPALTEYEEYVRAMGGDAVPPVVRAWVRRRKKRRGNQP